LISGDVGSEVIVIRSNETGEVRELHPRLSRLDSPNWSPDSRSILVRGSDEHGQQGLFLVDVQTGQEQALLSPAPGEGRLWAAWGPEGKTLFVHTWGGEEGTRIGIRDLNGGPEKVLVRGDVEHGPPGSRFGVSPDGKALAYYRRRGDGPYSLEVLTVASSEVRQLAEFPPKGPAPLMVEWGPDGRYIYYLRSGGAENPEEKGLWRVPADGGTPEHLGWSTEVKCYLTGFQPNGNRIALMCGEGEGGDEVWVMENFLPGTEARRGERRKP
jgi:Tol biopolymer transport system component